MKAPRLKAGDRIGLVSPGTRPQSPAIVKRACRVVEELGLAAVPGQHLLDVHGHLAGTDQNRLEDINRFIRDDSICGVFCVTGGFGALSILPGIDYGALTAAPKIFLGSDENTVLMLAIHKQCGLTTFLGPNLDRITRPDSFAGLKEALLTEQPIEIVCDTDALGRGITLSRSYSPFPGVVSGTLMGGHLSAIISMLGTPYAPDFSSALLYLDDYEERNDTLDRWFTNLYVSGTLSAVCGVAFGAFEGCGPRGNTSVLSIEDLFEERLIELCKPSLFGLPIGHNARSLTIPIGVPAELDTNLARLKLLDSGTQ